MDKSIIIYANHYTCTPGERIQNGPVDSRMLLWANAGKGQIRCNEHTFEVMPGTMLWLPWGRFIDYEADHGSPFTLAGIHVIPEFIADQEIVWQVAHYAEHPLYAVPARQDGKLPGGSTPRGWSCQAHPDLWQMANAIVDIFQAGQQSVPLMRSLSQSLLLRLESHFQGLSTTTEPVELMRLKQWIEVHVNQPISIDTLAHELGRSASHVTRLFKAYAGLSPTRWVNQRKMQIARQRLLSTVMSVREVGESVGIGDQFYFSKCFKQQYGESPQQYRKHHVSI